MLYTEAGHSSIYFIIFPLVICYAHIDGRIQIETVFQALAWYSMLRYAILWDFTDGIVLLSQAIVSCTRLQVLMSVKCGDVS